MVEVKSNLCLHVCSLKEKLRLLPYMLYLYNVLMTGDTLFFFF